MEEITAEDAFNGMMPYDFVFVISIDNNNKPSGMIAGWYTKLGKEPPYIGVCLSDKGHTHKLIESSKEFVIAVPNKALEPAVRLFGSTHGNEVDKFTETNLKTLPAKHVKSPLLADATFNFECRLENEVKVRDHIFFIGEVLTAHKNPDMKKRLFQTKKVGDERVFEEF